MLITALSIFCCVGDAEWEQMHKDDPIISCIAFIIIFLAWPIFMLLVIKQANEDDL